MAELAKKVTRTVEREYDADGKLTSETVTVQTKKFEAKAKRVVGFAQRVEIAK